MAQKFLTLLAMCAALAFVLDKLPLSTAHENEGRIRREASSYDDDTSDSGTNWTACDVATTPLLSCHDCSTRLICKPIGGFLKVCNNPFRPHCNSGFCSRIPSPECASG